MVRVNWLFDVYVKNSLKNVLYIHKANYLDYFIYFYFAFIYDTRKSYFEVWNLVLHGNGLAMVALSVLDCYY